ncbi:hypothetical protein BP6252_12630 [Coleophoma cylindrospora]|uniref:Uncharacterized protein n=1 Tax=Coleophoma cylindrospora TaxID=1849047 RepID=A0A3D8QCG9_9HELO|nr:hypothetical protein BP6252_12630 [Coleophoma cylindrospora]
MANHFRAQMREAFFKNNKEQDVERENILYSQTSASDTDLPQEQFPITQPAKKYHRYVGVFVKVLLYALATIGIISLGLKAWETVPKRSALQQTNLQSCFCGNSIAEAEALGCVYDTVSVHWLPPHCHDAEVTKEFNHAGPGPDGQWYYYTDKEGTGLFTIEDLGSMFHTNGSFWVTHEWHIAHCTYLWRKQSRSRSTGITFEKVWDTPGHIAHCEKMFRRRDALETITAVTRVGRNADLVPLFAED